MATDIGGDLTFLFADIEGSTPLVTRLGADRYAVVLDAVLDALRQAISEAGGEVIRVDGDGVVAILPSPTAAVTAAVEATRYLTEHPPPFALRPRLRTGIHLGPGRRRDDGDLIGLGVHQAARVVAAAQGGQIVVSSAARETIAGAPGIDLVDAGPHHLRDFDGPQRLHLVRAVDLPFDDQPLRAPTATVHNVPPMRSPLVGRDTDVEELVKLLARSRSVTVTGPGGVGKTSLVLEVARRATAMFADGVWVVDLTGVAPGDDIDGFVAASIGCTIGERVPRDAIAEHVVGRRLLVVLDNCEHVIDSAAAIVDVLLDTETGSGVLATSRERLAVRGEDVWRLEPLAVPPPDAPLSESLESPSVRVLTDRTSSLGVRASDAPADALIEIARLVDGLPLALELAAGRIADEGAAVVVENLRRELAGLEGGYRTDAARHRGLRALVAASYDRLEESDRAAFRRAAVLLGSVPADIAGEIVGGGDASSGAASLGRLLERSLIEGATDGEVRVLEPLREVGLELLVQAGEDTTARELHAAVFERVTKELVESFKATDGATAEAWRGISPAVMTNARAALYFAFDHAPASALSFANAASILATRSGLGSDAQAWMERALDGAPADSPDRLQGLTNLAQVASTRGHLERAEHYWTLLEAAIDQGDAEAERYRGLLLVGRGGQAMMRGAPAEAIELLEDGIPRLVDAGFASQAAQSRNALAGALTMSGRAPEALEQLRVGIGEATEIGDPHLLAMLHLQMGIIEGITGNHDAAATACAEAVESFRGMGDTTIAGLALFNLGSALHHIGDTERARTRLEEAVATARRLGDQRLLVLSLRALGGIDGDAGNLEPAARALSEAAATAELAGLESDAAKARAAVAAIRCSTTPDAALAASTGADVRAVTADPLSLAEVSGLAAWAWAAVDRPRAAVLAAAHHARANALGVPPRDHPLLVDLMHDPALAGERQRGASLDAGELADIASGAPLHP